MLGLWSSPSGSRHDPKHESSIAHGIASRLFKGERYNEVARSVCEYFAFHSTVRPIDDPGKGSLRMREPYKPDWRSNVVDEPYKGSLRMRKPYK